MFFFSFFNCPKQEFSLVSSNGVQPVMLLGSHTLSNLVLSYLQVVVQVYEHLHGRTFGAAFSGINRGIPKIIVATNIFIAAGKRGYKKGKGIDNLCDNFLGCPNNF